MPKVLHSKIYDTTYSLYRIPQFLLYVCAITWVLITTAQEGHGQIISQYIETESGTRPKGVEIWNNTKDTLDFSIYPLSILKGTNGSQPTLDFILEEGQLAPTKVIVIGTSDMEMSTTNQGASFFEENFTFNGDDALVIKYGDSITDIFGNPGEDPGVSWSSSGVSTNNVNLKLHFGIQLGDVVGWVDPSIRFNQLSVSPSLDIENGRLSHLGIAPATSTALVKSGQWHLLSIPKYDANLTEISDDVHIQGILGSSYAANNPNIYLYDKKGEWSVPTSMDMTIEEGVGIALYHFDEIGMDVEQPTVLDITGPEVENDVGVALNKNGPGAFTLVGNPFASHYHLSSIELNQGTIQHAVQIWNPVESTYETVMHSSDYVLSPWQAFWVESTDSLADSLNFPRTGQSYMNTSDDQAKRSEPSRLIQFSLRSELTLDRALSVYFRSSASYDWDIFDASKMLPSTQWLGALGIEKEGRLKSVESLPTDIQGSVLLPIRIITNVYGKTFTLEWKGIANLPTEISCFLIDYKTGEKIDLRSNDIYQFTLEKSSKTQFSGELGSANTKSFESYETSKPFRELTNRPIEPLIHLQALDSNTDIRFALLLQNRREISINTESSYGQYSDQKSMVSLDPNYPNPFNPRTAIYYKVMKPTFLQLKIFDSLGRLVTVLENGYHGIGEYQTQWNASGKASGIFYLQLTSQDELITQTMLLLK